MCKSKTSPPIKDDMLKVTHLQNINLIIINSPAIFVDGSDVNFQLIIDK